MLFLNIPCNLRKEPQVAQNPQLLQPWACCSMDLRAGGTLRHGDIPRAWGTRHPSEDREDSAWQAGLGERGGQLGCTHTTAGTVTQRKNPCTEEGSGDELRKLQNRILVFGGSKLFPGLLCPGSA